MAKIVDKRYTHFIVSDTSTDVEPVKNAVRLDRFNFIVLMGSEVIVRDESAGGLSGEMWACFFDFFSGSDTNKPVGDFVNVTTYTEEHGGVEYKYFKFVLPSCEAVRYMLV